MFEGKPHDQADYTSIKSSGKTTGMNIASVGKSQVRQFRIFSLKSDSLESLDNHLVIHTNETLQAYVQLLKAHSSLISVQRPCV